MIETFFSLQKPEYLEAQRLYLRHRSRRRRQWRIPLFALVLLVVFAVLRPTSGLGGALVATMAVAAGSLASAAALMFVVRPFFLGKRYKTEGRLLKDVHLTLDENGYAARSSGIGEGITSWTAFDSWLEGKTVFVLIVGYMFRAIPKQSLNAAEIAEVRTLLKAENGAEGVNRIHAGVST